LAVSDVTAPSLTIGDPAQVTVGWKVTNLGTGAGLTAAWTDQVIASPDGIAGNSDDVVLASFQHTGLLTVGQSYARSETFVLPPAFQGHNHLFVRTDTTGQVFENGLEANNAAEAPQFFDVMVAPYADLLVSALSAPAGGNSGQPLTVSWSVTNQGIGVTDRADWGDQIRLASDPDGKNIVADFGIFGHSGPLAVGDSYSRSADVAIPNGLSGTFYVVVTTGGPFEFIYTDNNRRISGPLTITLSPSPDLVVTHIAAPTQAVSGDKIDVTWTVRNDGTGAATGGWSDRLILREAGHPNGAITNLGTF